MGGIISSLTTERKLARNLQKNTRANLLVDEWEDPKRPLTPPDEQAHNQKLRWSEVLEDNRAFFAVDDPIQVTLRKDELVWVPSEDEGSEWAGDDIDSDEELRQQAMNAGSITRQDSESEDDDEAYDIPGATLPTQQEPPVMLSSPVRSKSGGLQRLRSGGGNNGNCAGGGSGFGRSSSVAVQYSPAPGGV